VEVGPIDDSWILFASLAGVAGVLGLLAWASARSRKRGIGASMMGVFDEMWRPTAAESKIEIQLQNERNKPIGSPEDL